jgi:AcrR family transcriptional regulator
MTETELQTRERLFEAAGPIFAERGFQAASVREICQKAGANLGAINYHFRSKEQFYIETVRHAFETLIAQVPLPDPPAGTPAEERLLLFVRAFLERLFLANRRAWTCQLLMRELAEPTEACAAFVRGFVRPNWMALQAILSDLLPADTPARTRHLIGSSVIGQCLHYHHARNIIPQLVGAREYSSYDVEGLAEHITEFTLAAIRKLHPPVRGGGS